MNAKNEQGKLINLHTQLAKNKKRMHYVPVLFKI